MGRKDDDLERRITDEEYQKMTAYLYDCLSGNPETYYLSFREFIEQVTGEKLKGSRRDISLGVARRVCAAAQQYRDEQGREHGDTQGI